MRIMIRKKDAVFFSLVEDAFQGGKAFLEEIKNLQETEETDGCLHENRWRFSVYAESEYIRDLEKNWYVVRLYLEMPNGNLVRVGYLG